MDVALHRADLGVAQFVMAIARLHEVDPAGNVRGMVQAGFALETSQVSLAAPPADGVAHWFVSEAATIGNARTWRGRWLNTLPVNESWTPTPLTEVSALTLSELDGRVAASWSLDRAAPLGDCVQLEWQSSSGGLARWYLFAPAGATATAFPALPPSMAPLSSSSTNGGVFARTLEATAPGAGRTELFGRGLIDVVATFGAFELMP